MFTTSRPSDKKRKEQILVEKRPVLKLIDSQTFEKSRLVLFKNLRNVRLNQIHFKRFAKKTVQIDAWSVGRCGFLLVTGEIDYFSGLLSLNWPRDVLSQGV